MEWKELGLHPAGFAVTVVEEDMGQYLRWRLVVEGQVWGGGSYCSRSSYGAAIVQMGHSLWTPNSSPLHILSCRGERMSHNLAGIDHYQHDMRTGRRDGSVG